MSNGPGDNGKMAHLFGRNPSVWPIVIALILIAVGCLVFVYWSTPDRGSGVIPAEALSKIEQEKAKAQKDYLEFMNTPAGKILQKHPYWNPEICKLIAEGQIVPGMSKDQVVEALGDPRRVKSKRDLGNLQEEWLAEGPGPLVLRFEDQVLKSVEKK